jgi:signal transduction histidine kinase
MLLYARSEHPTTQLELIDLNKFLADFAANLAPPVQVELMEEPFCIIAEGAALRRALTNLCENAKADRKFSFN